ncbi:MAG: hypothetical protein AAGG57_11350 [Pseudomonadota bacterium]
MNWTELTKHLAEEELMRHFPDLDDTAVGFLKDDKARLARHISEKHGLTETEATEAIDDVILTRSVGQPLRAVS